jgi:hypothetical protein
MRRQKGVGGWVFGTGFLVLNSQSRDDEPGDRSYHAAHCRQRQRWMANFDP